MLQFYDSAGLPLHGECAGALKVALFRNRARSILIFDYGRLPIRKRIIKYIFRDLHKYIFYQIILHIL